MAPISPIALFAIHNNKLMPVAIKLIQNGQVNNLLLKSNLSFIDFRKREFFFHKHKPTLIEYRVNE